MKKANALWYLMAVLVGLTPAARAQGFSPALETLKQLVESSPSEFNRLLGNSKSNTIAFEVVPSVSAVLSEPKDNPEEATEETKKEEPKPKEVSEWELLNELALAEQLPPNSHIARERAAMGLFIQAGAEPREIQTFKVGKYSLRNVYVVKRGTNGDRFIIVGAHVDKTAEGDGVFDNWAGAATVTNLYQAVRDFPTKHSILFVVFSGEEEALTGSHAFSDALTPSSQTRVDAMINMDVLGFGGFHYWKGGSTDELEQVAEEAAREAGFELTGHEIPQGASTDSYSFLKRGIPSITFDGIPDEAMEEALHSLHSHADRLRVTKPVSYIQAQRALVAILLAVDEKTWGWGISNKIGDPQRVQTQVDWVAQEDPVYRGIPTPVRQSAILTAWQMWLGLGEYEEPREDPPDAKVPWQVVELQNKFELTEEQAKSVLGERKKRSWTMFMWAPGVYVREGPEGIDNVATWISSVLSGSLGFPLPMDYAQAFAKRIQGFVEEDFKNLGIVYDGLLEEEDPIEKNRPVM